MNESQRELLLTGASWLGVTLNAAAVERFSTYLALLQLWGKKINLTTRLEAEEVIVYHFLDSLAAAPRGTRGNRGGMGQGRGTRRPP